MNGKLLAICAALASALAVSATGIGAAPAGSATTLPCKRGTVSAIVDRKHVCLALGQRCLTKFNFAYKMKHFVCVAGHLRKYVPPKPPPPPPAPPPAPPPPPAGHYAGTTSQNQAFSFDVDGRTIGLVVVAQIPETCTPADVALSAGSFIGLGPDIALDGTFTFTQTTAPTLGTGEPAQDTVTITGAFTGATAAGTLVETTTFTHNGTPYSCTSGNQTWTVARSG